MKDIWVDRRGMIEISLYYIHRLLKENSYIVTFGNIFGKNFRNDQKKILFYLKNLFFPKIFKFLFDFLLM